MKSDEEEPFLLASMCPESENLWLPICRGRTWPFFALQKLLHKLNNRPFKKLTGNRNERFHRIDKPALRELPAQRFEYFELVVHRKVPSDYHVEFAGHFYSVPHALVGTHVDIRITAGMVEVLQGWRRKCTHPRSWDVDKHSTLTEHLPEKHRYALNGEPAELLRWSEGVGPATHQLITFWLNAGTSFHRGHVSARGLRQDAEYEEAERIELACSYAERNQTKTLGSVRSILRHRLVELAAESSAISPPVSHENVRGPDYFADKEAV